MSKENEEFKKLYCPEYSSFSQYLNSKICLFFLKELRLPGASKYVIMLFFVK